MYKYIYVYIHTFKCDTILHAMVHVRHSRATACMCDNVHVPVVCAHNIYVP